MTVFNENRTYGVELEVHFSGSQRDLANVINAEFENQNIRASAYAAGYSHEDNRNNIWKIVSDGSIERGTGWEVVSPILNGLSGFEQIKAVCKALSDAGATISRQTGMHVHHDKSDLSPKQIGMVFGTYAAFQTLLNYAVSPSRRNAGFARQLSTSITDNGNDKWDDVQTESQMLNKLRQHIGNRYSAVNWDSMNPNSNQYHGTIEFRQHQGTTNATKVITWILVTQAIIERAVQGKARFPKTITSERASGKAHRKGDFYRFKTFIGVTADMNDHNMEASEQYMWAFKQLYKNLKKFSRQAGYSDVKDITR